MRKIVGRTVGTTIPKPNWGQNDPRKGDYIKGKELVDKQIAEALAALGGSGLSAEAAGLLITILQEALYGSDQSGNIQLLAKLLGVGGAQEPDEPDVPEVKKLDTPVIRLVTGDEPEEPVEPGEQTPAILGVAILGRTILGDYGSDLPKLGQPKIELVTVEDDAPKLGTPDIQLVTDALQLEQPKIELVTESEEEPALEKLNRPTIEIVVLKLATPTIKLETEE